MSNLTNRLTGGGDGVSAPVTTNTVEITADYDVLIGDDVIKNLSGDNTVKFPLLASALVDGNPILFKVEAGSITLDGNGSTFEENAVLVAPPSS